MTPEQLVDFIKTFYHNFESQNIEAIVASYADEVVWDNPMPEEIPFGGTYKGANEILGYFGELNVALEMGPMEINDFVAQNDTVVVTGRERSTVRATGKGYDMQWVHLYKVRDGKIVYGREYNNTAEMLKAFV